MWPLDQLPQGPQGLLHLGRHDATTTVLKGGSDLKTQHHLSLDHLNLSAVHGLGPALSGLLAQTPQVKRWVIAMDSAWLPLTVIPTDQAWTVAEIKALARQRWSSLYGATVGTWQTQTLYLPGDTSATVFGLPDPVKSALNLALTQQGGRMVSIQPSCLWAWSRSARLRKSHPSGIFLWWEEDRCVVCSYSGSSLCVLDPTADRPDSMPDLDRLLDLRTPSATKPLAVMLAGSHPPAWLTLSTPDWTLVKGRPVVADWIHVQAASGRLAA